MLFVRPSTLDMDISDGQCVRGMGGSATSAKSAAEGEAAVQTSAHANEQARVLDIPEFVSMGMSTQEQTHLRARTRRTAGSSSESSPSSSSTVSPAQSPRDRSTRESPREQMQGVEAATSAGAQPNGGKETGSDLHAQLAAPCHAMHFPTASKDDNRLFVQEWLT